MNLLYPLGLLGLIGIVIIIIIYLIKPNYQQKLISSTLIWKLSIKYRKKRLPINRLKNLIILICQILVITMGALILARPYLPSALMRQSNEKVFVIDASGTMLARQGNDVTRFERAIEEISVLGHQTIANGYRISLIIANQNPEAILLRTERAEALDEALNKLSEVDEIGLPSGCTFGEADIDGAMLLAENVLNMNPSAKVHLFTATEYEKPGHVIINNVAVNSVENEEDKHKIEWNAAIVNVTTTFEDNLFRFAIDVASYNSDEEITVYFAAYGVNGAAPETASKVKDQTVVCRDNLPVTVYFNDQGINTYSQIHIYIDADDSFAYDNNYYLFDGQKEELRVLYVTPYASNFFKGLLPTLWYIFQARWELLFETTSIQELTDAQREIKGYDFYIFEYQVPENLPTDGFVLLISPNEESDSGVLFGNEIETLTLEESRCRLISGDSSEIMKNVNPNNIVVRRYREIISFDQYVPYMYFPNEHGNDPVFLVKNTSTTRIAILAFATLFSDISLTFEFPTLLFNLINSMFPATVAQHVYNVGDTFVFDQEESILAEFKPSITVSGGWGINIPTVYESGTYVIQPVIPGVYDVTQTIALSNRKVTERCFVKVSSIVSDFTRQGAFKVPEAPPIDYGDYDIYIYFAAALCALIFIERLLHVKDEF